MTKVKITHARSNESGKISGGTLGDNNGKEISTTDFYIHSKGWNIIRAIDANIAATIAKTALAIAANDNFGYDQNYRDTGITRAKAVGLNISKVNVPCALDCSTTVRLCCICAGVDPGDIYTGNELQKLVATGKFKQVEFKSEDDLCVGDILVTKTKGHTAIVTSVGAAQTNSAATTKNGWDISKTHYYKNGELLKGQWLKDNNYWYYFSATDGTKLTGLRKIYDKNGKLRECFFGSDGKLYHEAADKQGWLEVWEDK